MKSETHALRFYGWFGLCPVYIGELSEAPVLAARHWAFEPLFWFSLQMFQLMNGLMEDGPGFPIRVKGHLIPGKVLTLYEDGSSRIDDAAGAP